MIIREKQILYLMQLASSYLGYLTKDNTFFGELAAKPIRELLEEIQNQQPQKLKEIE